MPRYTDDSREKVRDAVDFVDLVGSRIELRKAGVRRYTGLCPFHDERSPSFGIDPVEKVYYCFGCQAGGDVFRFVMETEGLGFGEALEVLADRYNVTLESTEDDPRAAERRARRDRLHGLLERTAAYYVRLLWDAPEAAGAREYLEQRGLDEQTCREFRVGYSPDAWDRVVSASMRNGYSVGELVSAGVAQRSQGGSGLIDRFRGRLMFPWADTRGRVFGFGARALKPDDTPKYLNSSEGEVFSKGRQVYGSYLARGAAAKAGAVVVVEGYTDVIALHQSGIRQAVGQQGTALTEDQAGELAKLAPVVYLALDNDRAGQDAMLRAASVLRGLAKPPEVRVVGMPAGADPADFVLEHGADAVRELLDKASPFARWHVELTLSRGDLASSEGRDQVLTAIGPTVRAIPPGLVRDELVRLVGDALKLNEHHVLEILLRGASRAAPQVARPNGGAGAAGPGTGSDVERTFLALCIAFPAVGQKRLDGLEPDQVFLPGATARAAAHLRDHLRGPMERLDPDDVELAHLMAQLVMRARALEDTNPSELERFALMLERDRIDRAIITAQRTQGPVTELALERQRLAQEIGKLLR